MIHKGEIGNMNNLSNCRLVALHSKYLVVLVDQINLVQGHWTQIDAFQTNNYS